MYALIIVHFGYVVLGCYVYMFCKQHKATHLQYLRRTVWKDLTDVQAKVTELFTFGTFTNIDAVTNADLDEFVDYCTKTTTTCHEQLESLKAVLKARGVKV